MAIDEIAQDIELEKRLKAHFGGPKGVRKVVLRSVSVGGSARATVFLGEDRKPYVLIFSHTKLQVGDVKKILSKMGLKTAAFIPPKARPDYFHEEAAKKFLEVFPGRKVVQDSDLVFYKTLVTYSPALAQITEVTNGTIMIYDDDARGKWRPGIKFSYKRIDTKQ
jgi:hypothetical protein